jgi:drug/metabolite transporter (DMT)-like permease
VAGVGALVGFDVGSSDLLAAGSVVFVVIGYALGPWVLSRYLSDLAGPTVITTSLALCAIAYAPVAVWERPEHALSGSVIASMVCLTVVCTAVAFVCFFALVAEVGPMRSTVVTYVNPAVAVLLGVTVLGEPFGAATAVGFVLVLAGSVLATRRARPAGGTSTVGGVGDRAVPPPAPTVAEP